MENRENSEKKDEKKGKKKQAPSFLSLIVFLILVVLAILYIKRTTGDKIDKAAPKKIYTEFMQDVEDGKVDLVVYSDDSEQMTVYLFDDNTRNMSYKERQEYEYDNDTAQYYVTEYPAYFDFRKDLLEKNVRLEVYSTRSVIEGVISLITLAPLLFCTFMVMFSMRKMLGGFSTNVAVTPEKTDVHFTDIIGHDEIMEDAIFYTNFLKNPKLGEDVGAKPPRGILLTGDPGVGKTQLARAMATEADVPFLYVKSSSIVEMYAGLGAKRIRDIFAKAYKQAPCIIFIDEIDAIGQKRGSGGSVETEYTQIIDALLQELDGMSDRSGIFVIAATNRPEVLDSALIRSGRFDRTIVFNKPKDWKTRLKLALHFAERYKCDENLDLESFCRQCTGYTGADIESVLNQASLIATKKGTLVTTECVNEAFENKLFQGNRTKNSDDEIKKDKELVAYHEAGHAVASLLLGLPIERISVIGNTSGVGGAVFNSDDGSKFETKEKLEKRIQVCYAGRASEEIKFDSVSTGAVNDIEVATEYLVNFIEKYGFDDEFGLVSTYALRSNNSIETQRSERVSRLAKKYYGDVKELLKGHYTIVEAFAEKLLECETMGVDEVYDLYKSLTGEEV